MATLQTSGDATARQGPARAATTHLWWAGLLTLLAAVGFLIVIAVVTMLLFGLLGRWAVQAPADSGRPAKVGLVCSILGLVGILLFWVSAPIILGGLGATLGYVARRRRAVAGHGRMALAALVIGTVAAVTGMGIWLVG